MKSLSLHMMNSVRHLCMNNYRGCLDEHDGDLRQHVTYMQTCTDDKPILTKNFQRSTKLKASHYRPADRCIPLGSHTGMTDCAEKKLMVTEVGAEPQIA